MDFNENQKAAAVALAKEIGSNALTAAGDISSVMKNYIQRGPEGVGWLCFIGGLITCLFGFLGLFDIFGVLVDPLEYVINAYQMAFGFTVCVIEAPQEWVEKSPRLEKAQKFIFEFAKFLTTFGGRGAFYLFQGSLALSITSMASLSFILGFYMSGLGVLCIAMQYGFKPDLSMLNGGQANGSSFPTEGGGDFIRVV
eukprot:TRINITY_DN22133_c0_g3_i1.p1 TRINITY_DN22133_c0_g3~~TRINITY_DN22133_c0_g3_i1.p1  ORF type:complete len:197 (-),score=42.96 TRINITY_DN22133_c0_g3_i1:170-760(-)